jgi:superfamily II DNA or RNA helicase
VVIGDVVGLGKTLMASAVARIFEDDQGLETLIICPKNLVKMWEDYRDRYRMRARVLSLGRVINEIPNLRRFRLVIIDESQNLRNREGKRYRAIQEYLQENESKVILLSATPYNKTYLDLANQLRLFVNADKDIGIRPERLLRDIGETEFLRQHQCSVRSLAAFEKSEYPEDWQELMRLFMVRRTRSFIKENYAQIDPETKRKYLIFEDGSPSYFPERKPKTLKFTINDKSSDDQYARLYADNVVTTINSLCLPRYGLGNYIMASPHKAPTQNEAKIIQNLARAGKRLMGFCRTGLFKRLESSGYVFIESLKRHILRNYVFIYAIENGQDIPIGTQDVELLDPRYHDGDADDIHDSRLFYDDEEEIQEKYNANLIQLLTEEDFKKYAERVYDEYTKISGRRFKWLRPNLFTKSLLQDLRSDANLLLHIFEKCGNWVASEDKKLDTLFNIIANKHPKEKIVVFSQYADTVRYLEKELITRGIERLAGVTGDLPDPTAIAWRFSPESNEKRQQIDPNDELRVIIATDVLSEGQNLQDAYIVINYDLPWAIIRLVQRVGRIDRIGQKAESIICYSFLPAEGVERIIRLRERVRRRLKENAEVVGTDEAFFEDDEDNQAIIDLYNEKAGILDGEDETEVDLASYAYQIWNNAITQNPGLKKTVENLPPVVYATKPHTASEKSPEGVLVYVRTMEGNDALAWIDRAGNSITESQFSILKAAQCKPDTPPLPRHNNHHEIVKKGVELIVEEEKLIGGQLGRPSGARFRTYERLKGYADLIKGTIFESQELHKAIEDIYRYPLRQSTIDSLNRQLRTGISDESLAQLVIALRDENRLCIIHEEELVQEPKIICSMGLASEKK